jgi:predicted phosphodiesterase
VTRIAACGGVYSNPYALRAFIGDARARGAERLLCLGDLGGFGAEPDAVWPLLQEAAIECIAGNYELAVSAGGPECGCGYRDPLDNRFAQVIYDYTLAHTGRDFARWMGTLATERRERVDGWEMHLVHGSTLGVNDFWWESLPSNEHRRRVAASGADVILCTHSGLPWQRRVGTTLVVNVGVLGRPANDGRQEVWYCLLDVDRAGVSAQLVPLAYDWRAQATSMRRAGLPEVFAESIETGWWTTCLECLPPLERSRGRFQIYRSALPGLMGHYGLPAPAEEVDVDNGRPVVPLFGSPLLPARLWIHTRAASDDGPAWPGPRRFAHLGAQALEAGFTQLVLVQHGAETTRELDDMARLVATLIETVISPAGMGSAPAGIEGLREIAMAPDGVYWHVPGTPLEIADGLLVRPAAGEPVGVAEARRLATQRFLEQRAAGTVSCAI